MAPKYKLHSAEKDGDVKLCAFFSTPEGCKNGANCKFSHGETTSKLQQSSSKNCVPVTIESSSVVSSESSDNDSFSPSPAPKSSEKKKKKKKEKGPHKAKEVKAVNTLNKEENQFQKNLRLLQEQQKQLVELQQKLLQQQGSAQKQKQKKRKQSEDKDASIFANNSTSSVKKTKTATPTPKKTQNPQKGSYAALAEASDVSDTNEDDEDDDEGLNYLAELKAKLNKHVATPSKQSKKKQTKSPNNQSFSLASKLSLPIAPFNLKGMTPTAPKASQSSVSSEEEEFPSPMPSRSSDAYKFILAIKKTREHPRYSNAYDLSKRRVADDSDHSWIKTKPISRKTSSNPRAIAIDCEMVETLDSDSGKRDHKALARISVVNAFDTSQVLLDTLVKPPAPVRDYRTFVNGITKEALEGVEFTLEHAQAFMMALCDEETVIIGHSVHNDLVALKMEHFCTVDTSYLFKVKGDESESKSAIPSLKDCAALCLEKEMPATHCSVNDAITALECCEYFLEKKGKVEEVTKTTKKSYDGSDSLLVHRIPAKGCTKKDLSNLFLHNCSVKPKEVEDIAYGSSTGKTNVIFPTSAHALLAFDSLSGSIQTDKTGREQKKVYLRNGDYIQVRKMTKPRKRDSM